MHHLIKGAPFWRSQEVIAAFEVLADDVKRALYDSGRRRGPGQGERCASAQAPGGHARATATISLRQAVLGGEATVTALVLRICEACDGGGQQAGVGAEQRCPMCRGRGEVEVSRSGAAGAAGALGRLRLLERCPGCGGRGFPASAACSACGGGGLARRRAAMAVAIPPGTDDGDELRLQGQGDVGTPPGDLLVAVCVEQERGPEAISRQGCDLRSRLRVPLWAALLGAEASVQTLWGHASLAIPPGTQHGALLAVAAAGAPQRGQPSERGAHLFEVCIQLPELDPGSEQERELLERLAVLRTRQQQREEGGRAERPARARQRQRGSTGAAGAA